MPNSGVIAAISTPQAAGGIAVIRISGNGADGVASKVFRPTHSLEKMGGYTACHGHFFDEKGDFDDGIAIIYRAPHSYTGEDTVELCCHGGIYLAQKVLSALLQNGAKTAAPGEFTRRAYENGKLDLTAAESVMQLIGAEGDAALREAAEAGKGRLFARINALAERCSGLAASLAAWTDYPDEDLPPPDGLESGISALLGECRAMLSDFERGRVYREGLKTVIIGRPNVGKSALMNLLSGCERSIVAPVAGTTRDVVEEKVRLGGLILRLSDTAGIRDGGGMIERLGVERTKAELESAELILAVFDGSKRLDARDREVISLCENRPALCIINKNDLPQVIKSDELKNRFAHLAVISALDPNSAEALEKAICETAKAVPPTGGGIFTLRQKECLCQAEAALCQTLADCRGGITCDAVQVGLEKALSALCELTGQRASERIIDRIFADFCVGK